MGLKEIIFGGNVKGLGKNAGGEYQGSIQEWLPIKNIVDGVIVTKDLRFVKVIEVLPVNFHLKTPIERQNIIACFAAYLKTAPSNLQFRVITQKLDLGSYIEKMKRYLESEPNEKCREMIEDNIAEITHTVSNEIITHRFFIAFEHGRTPGPQPDTVRGITKKLNEEAGTASRYLELCGIEVLVPEYSDNATLEILYGIINKRTSRRVSLPEGVFDMMTSVHGVYGSVADD
jgi:hypothetical protein